MEFIKFFAPESCLCRIAQEAWFHNFGSMRLPEEFHQGENGLLVLFGNETVAALFAWQMMIAVTARWFVIHRDDGALIELHHGDFVLIRQSVLLHRRLFLQA